MGIRGLWVTLCCIVTSVSIASTAVHNLRDDTFDDFVDALSDDTLLLVDFFKPSCRHCQRLNPVLDYLDKEWEEEEPDPAKRWFQIAKVDCSKNPRLVSVFGIRKLPDLRFVRAGQWSTYDGGRKIEDLREFKTRMAVIPLPALSDQELRGLVSQDEVAFVLATDAEPGMDAARVAPGVVLAATGLQHRAVFGTVTRETLSELGLCSGDKSLPALVKVMAGPSGLQSLAFQGKLTSSAHLAIMRWVESENYPMVSEFRPNTFSRLGDVGKLVAIGVVDPTGSETADFKRAFDTVAWGMGLKHSDKLVFGYVDGIQLAGFAETLNIYDGLPRLVVLDMHRDLFYGISDMRMDAMSMEAFLFDVLSGGVAPQRSPSDSVRIMTRAWWMIRHGGAWSFLLLIPLLGLLWVCCDTPQWEEQREAARETLRREKEAQEEARRLKKD